MMSFHRWVDLYVGLKKGRGRFLNFSDAPIPGKNYIFIFLAVNAKPTSAVLNVYFVIITVYPSYWSVQLAFDSHWLNECANLYGGIFDLWAILCCLGLVRHQRQAIP
jgi:hypothetical protein